jgi:hypothetical protein
MEVKAMTPKTTEAVLRVVKADGAATRLLSINKPDGKPGLRVETFRPSSGTWKPGGSMENFFGTGVPAARAYLEALGAIDPLTKDYLDSFPEFLGLPK